MCLFLSGACVCACMCERMSGLCRAVLSCGCGGSAVIEREGGHLSPDLKLWSWSE